MCLPVNDTFFVNLTGTSMCWKKCPAVGALSRFLHWRETVGSVAAIRSWGPVLQISCKISKHCSRDLSRQDHVPLGAMRGKAMRCSDWWRGPVLQISCKDLKALQRRPQPIGPRIPLGARRGKAVRCIDWWRPKVESMPRAKKKVWSLKREGNREVFVLEMAGEGKIESSGCISKGQKRAI